MMEYIDARGWRYRVMKGLNGYWKARYRKPDQPGQKPRGDDKGWKCVARLFWHKTKREAEHDLAMYAKHRGMHVKEETE